jgi:serine/threonine protein phosphatase 1
MKRLIVGDIHGCYEEFQELLEKVGLSADDEIISVGDLVDRGPDSPAVLNFFRATPNARAVLGNHERKHVRSFRGEIEPALSQVIARQQIGEADYPAACDFMWSLPHWIDLPDALIVHGFFEPGVPVGQQRETVIVGTLSGEDYLRKTYDRLWYELYDGDKPLIVGHRNYTGSSQPLIYQERVYGLDTRCYEGQALTGLLLPEFRIISVPARDNHWARLKRQYHQLAERENLEEK